MEQTYREYLISDNKERIDPLRVQKFLSTSYWAKGRELSIIKKTIQNSHCIGVYFNNIQVGFARVVTDYAVYAWIADVVVDEEHRGQGLGKLIISFIQNIKEIPQSTQMLRTKDAHALYEKFGFTRCECMSK
jgi:GNAT superfamily N-acetyltransferase